MTDILDSARRLLSITPGRWQSLVEAAPDELLQRAPAPGEWSAAQCLDHLLVAERAVFGARLRAILDSRDLPVFDPNAPREPEAERTPHAVAAALAVERE